MINIHNTIKTHTLFIAFIFLVSGCNTTPNWHQSTSSDIEKSFLFKKSEIPKDRLSKYYSAKIDSSNRYKLKNEYFQFMHKKGTNNLYVFAINHDKYLGYQPELLGLNHRSRVGFPSLNNENLTNHSIRGIFSKISTDDHGELTKRLVSYLDKRNLKYLEFEDVIDFLENSESIVAFECQNLQLICKANTEYNRKWSQYESRIEILDYRDTIEQHHKAIESRNFQEAFSLKIPSKFVDRKVYLRAINNSNNLAETEVIRKLIDENGIDDLTNSLITQQNELTFKNDYELAIKKGYARQKQFIKTYNELFSGNKKCYKVQANSLNIRQEAKSSSRKVGSYTLGKMICSNKIQNDWVRTDKGWVDKKYLVANNYEKGEENYLKIVKIVDEKEYYKAIKDNTILSYKKYLQAQPQGLFISQVTKKLTNLFVQQNSFNGYLNAYKLTSDMSLLSLAEKSVLGSSKSVHVNSELVDTYFNAVVNHKYAIPRFINMTKKMQSVNSVDYTFRMLKLSGISKNFNPETYLNSLEYKYVLSGQTPRVTVLYKHDFISILLDYSDFRITIKEDAKCTFKKSESGVRDRGTLESLFSLNFDDKESYTYDVYSCQLNNSELNQIQAMLKEIDSYRPDESVDKLANNWETNRSTGSYTYSESRSSYTNSSSSSSNSKNHSQYLSQDGVWIKLSCADGTNRTIRDCKNGYYEAGSTGIGGCHYKGRYKAAVFVCESYGGFKQ